MMDVRALRTEADYAWALEQIEPYFDREPTPGSAEGDRFDVLATLIEAYEGRSADIPNADPVEILQYAIDNLGRTQKDLARVLGSRSRASEILGRQRALTLDMMRAISEAWRLPIAALAQPYNLAVIEA